MAETLSSQNGKKNQSHGEGGVAYLDHALWRQLADAEKESEFCQAWLSLQVRFMSGIHSGMVVLAPAENSPFEPVAIWPNHSTKVSHLIKVCERSLKEGKGVVSKDENSAGATNGTASYFACYPVRVNGSVLGGVALDLAARPPEELQAVMRQLQWGVAWLEKRVLQREKERESAAHQRMIAALEMAAVALEEEDFSAASTSFATILANRFQFHRASIGFLKRKHVKVHALSHSAQFKKQMNLIRAIGAAMDESLEQQVTICYPSPSSENLVTRSHAALVDDYEVKAVCTVPFVDRHGKGYGAMTVERDTEALFSVADLELLQAVAALAGPILEEQRKNHRLLIFKAYDSARVQIHKLLGPGHLVLKVSTGIVLLLVIFFTFATGDFRVTAKTTIEGAVQRAIVAPFDGFIYEAHVRAGDKVAQGQVMCSLDERELRLQRLKWASQRQQYVRQYREAMATGNRASMRVLREQVNQAEAQFNLLDDQIAHAKLKAPFNGIVVSGDLSQSLGSPVERSKVLFEVAPLENYRVKLHVDEHDISYIKIGQRGDLVLNSLPDIHFPITIQKITPITTAEEGKSFFQVEAALDHNSERLRPGMEGFGKIEIGRRKLIWIWVHDLINWVRLWVWSWWP